MQSIFSSIRLVSLFALQLWMAISLSGRERICINEGWRFTRGDPPDLPVRLCYETWRLEKLARVDAEADGNINLDAISETRELDRKAGVLKPWVLPTGNPFIKDPIRWYPRPGADFPMRITYASSDFDDSGWSNVDLPHDWAIAGTFSKNGNAAMGKLPTTGVGWYRKQIFIPPEDVGKHFWLEFEGAMSYAVVWVNGQIAGGWPYGYASWYLDITPYVQVGETNTIAVRLDNPPDSSRWYPGAGIYRNVWLVKVHPIHVDFWGVYVRTPEVSKKRALVEVSVFVRNGGEQEYPVEVTTEIIPLGPEHTQRVKSVAMVGPITAHVRRGEVVSCHGMTFLRNPKLWGPPPNQQPNLYRAVTTVRHNGVVLDRYETTFGIRSLRFDPEQGLFINGERVPIKGVNLHHDLGPLGAAFNKRAARRQLETLREMGCNAIRTAHNPPAPELLDLCDEMGLLVLDETFDVWVRRKTPYDFHQIFSEWHEQDLRAHVRRDRNHPSVIIWSIGNEVGEQYTGEAGAKIAQRLVQIVREEDPFRPVTTAMNWAKPDMPLPAVVDIIGLNYQGEGIRYGKAYEGLSGYRCPPQYIAFRNAFPEKMILSTETAAAVSTRGTYLFPVYDGDSAPTLDGSGGDASRGYVSAYELYTAPFGSSPDCVFATLDKHPFVAGEFVWSGWDYLGEPTPFYTSRSSYFGIVDLAGFKKDRFYLYQSRWRPELPMVHVVPHWTWPDRVGQVVPVHVFTTGDEVELFLNGRSLGRKKKGPHQYRLRWDDVVYEPGSLRAISYRNGKVWAMTEVRTAGEPVGIALEPDRKKITADGSDLAFVTVRIIDRRGITVPWASHRIRFEVEGPAKIVATDNGDPTDFESFASPERNAFNGLCLVILRGLKEKPGTIKLVARSEGLAPGLVKIRAISPEEAQK